MEGPVWQSTLPFIHPTPSLADTEILEHTASSPGSPALTDARTGRALTRAQLADGAARVAAGLGRQGIGRGDVVAVVAANSVDFVMAAYGALRSGATLASANPALTASELARQFAITRPKLVFVDDGSFVPVTAALATVGSMSPVYSLDESRGAPPIADLLAPVGPSVPGRTPTDVAFLFPSSGTTGLPKIVVHTHASASAFLQAIEQASSMRVSPADVVGVTVPLAHMFGIAIASHALRLGAPVVTMAVTRPDLEAFLRMIQDHRVTVCPVALPLLLALARHPLVDQFDLSSLRCLIAGAAPSPPEAKYEVHQRLGCTVADSLGATECWCHAPAADPPELCSAGRVGAGLQAVIVDREHGIRVGAGELGELWVRGPQVMAGYLGDDVATAEVLTDGWLHTGDVCSLDADGNVFVVDRLKEMIKVGGYSVAPTEVEQELIGHPAIVDAAVIRRPDPERGELPVAYVVTAPDATVDLDEVRAWLATRLAPWKQIHELLVVAEIPRSPNGKILRRVLVERERATAAQPVR